MATTTYAVEENVLFNPSFTPHPSSQSVLLLNAVKQPYSLVSGHNVPSILHSGEILIKVLSIGLNPIDWKAPAFNFGIPRLPWINGRDLAGIVVRSSDSSRLKVGDTVLVPSTDYRDIRKAAFQEYAITTYFNAARIPSSIPVSGAASVGVAFVAASLALGVSLGLEFSHISALSGPDLVDILRKSSDQIPEDVRGECFPSERLKSGEWIAIWGGSTTTGLLVLQLAKLAGLKVITVADVARHGSKLHSAGADVLVDRQDPERAVQIIRGVTGSNLRYAIDIVGRDTATLLQEALNPNTDGTTHSHLLGLTGLPKERREGIQYHIVPIKTFHTCPAVGEGLVRWLEGLLEKNILTLPEVVSVQGGLGAINEALERLRDGSVSGKRIVVDL